MTFVIKRADIRNPVTNDIINGMQSAIFTARDWPGAPKWTHGDWFIAYARKDGKLIEAGYGGLIPSQNWHGTGYLCSAGVLPEYRGQGLQKRLITKRVERAAERGWRWLITYTSVDNAASANSLINAGFRLYVPKRPWAGAAFAYWRKDLHGSK